MPLLVQKERLDIKNTCIVFSDNIISPGLFVFVLSFLFSCEIEFTSCDSGKSSLSVARARFRPQINAFDAPLKVVPHSLQCVLDLRLMSFAFFLKV